MIRLLGPLEITGPQGVVPVRGAGQRTLVARLALRPGETVHRAALLEALWAKDAPPTANETMHSLLTRLRRELSDASMGGLISRREPGYVLHAPAEEIDAVHFEALVAAGHNALATGNAEVSARNLREALRLWSGDPLADCRQGAWTRQQAARLAELRMSATEDLADAELILGHNAEVIGELTSLVALYPSRERLWKQLMLALYRAGRQADALAAYDRARTVLAEPGQRLRLLGSAVLRSDPSLTPGSTVQAGDSYRVDLARLSNSALVPHTIADALNVVDQTGRRPLAVLTEHLRDRQVSVVLDNCGHVMDHCAIVADTLREAAPELRILKNRGRPAASVRRRPHRDLYLTLAEEGERDWFSPRQADTIRRMTAEHANLRAALEFCLTTPGEARAGLRLAGTLWYFWVGCGHLAEGKYWLDWALSLDEGPSPERCKALWVNGYVSALHGNTASVASLMLECRNHADELDDQQAVANAVYVVGAAAVFQGDIASGSVLLEKADQRQTSLGQLDSNVMMTRIALAMALMFRGDLGRAQTLCEETRKVCEANGEQWAMAYALYVLALLATQRGDLEEASLLAVESLKIKQHFHDLLGVYVAVELLALLAVLRGDAARAAMLLGSAERMRRNVGLPLFESERFAASHRRAVELATRALGEAGFDAAFRRGRAMTWEQVA